MERKLKYVAFSDEGSFVARCLDVEVASDGSTELEAVSNLKEALELYFENRQINLIDLPTRTYQLGEIAVQAYMDHQKT